MRSSIPAALASMLLAIACSGAPPSATAARAETSARCGDVTGEWSSAVDGLRGRIVTSGSRADRSALEVVVELENVGEDPLAIHWDGRPDLGFVTFRLDEESGAEVAEPEWRLGGNEPGGSLRAVIAPSASVRHTLGDVFSRFDGGRILRIGAFWAREMPSDGSRRYLRGRAIGRAPSPDDLLVEHGGGDEGTTVRSSAGPQARAWTGPLELPAVCID